MKLELPQSWEDVTIKQFAEIVAARENYPDDLELIIEILSILSGVERQKLEALDLAALKKAYTALDFLEKESLPEKPEQRITVNGTEYFADFRIDDTLTGGEYMLVKNYTRDANLINHNIHNILAVLYKPALKKLRKKMKHSEIAQEFLEHMPITVAYPVAVFFWNLLNDWKHHLLLSSADRIAKQARQTMKEKV